MEPESLVVQHLKAIRESIEANGARIEANTSQIRELVERVDGNTAQLRQLGEHVDGNTAQLREMSERLAAVELAIVGYTAQITMFSRSLTVQMEARNRLEDKLEDALRRIEALETDKH
jgi:chromosome segregation ATPase